MIMSQYAILDAASKRTKLVPAFVLEGAPEQERVVPTYVAFWRQRVRWSLGGMDELNSIRKVRLQHLLVSSRDFSPLPPGWRIVAQAQWRRFRLLISWLKEHLWWSGIVAAPVLWMIAEMACGAPPWEARLFGCLCIFLVPGLLLQTLFYRHVAPLIPGGVSRSQLVALLFALITLSIPMVLPVLFAQLVCLAGQRGRYAGWNPATPKPGSQFSMGNKDASEQILVTDAEKERV
jgi:cellulose synthase/poly-beta-1,6-N-acetylglucosamine synthase-like glycosyltransferase